MKDGFIRVGACSPEIRLADPEYNADLIIESIKKADKTCVRLLAFPELILTGYTCKDLFTQELLLNSAEKQLKRIARETRECKLISVIGAPLRVNGRLRGCAAVISGGKIIAAVKQKSADSGAAGGKGCFSAFGAEPPEWEDSDIFMPQAETVFECVDYRSLRFGVVTGDDLWAPGSVSDKLTANGALIAVNCAADAELAGKAEKRKRFAKVQSEKTVSAYIYCGAGAGESTADAVYSGHCFIFENGELLAEKKPFAKEPEILIAEIDLGRLQHERLMRPGAAAGAAQDPGHYAPIIPGYCDKNEYGCPAPCAQERLPVLELHRRFRRNPFIPESKEESDSRMHTLFMIQSMGLKRRIEHTNAKCVVLGVSGGLDSSLALLVAVNACDIIGTDRHFIKAISMPCFGTSEHTRTNAEKLCGALSVDYTEISVSDSVERHFRDIGLEGSDRSVVYENAQARMRTLLLMDMANKLGGFVIGTGDLSEQALGWTTYNGDHMSMYGLNAGIPKTVIRELIRRYAEKSADEELKEVLFSILNTPVSPELLPAKDGEISQKTEDLVGPYELHDFFLYYVVRWGYPPAKLYRIAKEAFRGSGFDGKTILKWLKIFYRRFFSQQFKRDCMPDGPAVGSVCLSPRAGFVIPSDAAASLWLDELNELK